MLRVGAGFKPAPTGDRCAGGEGVGLFIFECQWGSSFVVSLSNHERAAFDKLPSTSSLRQAQGERNELLVYLSL